MFNLKVIILSITIITFFFSYVYGNINQVHNKRKVFSSYESNRKIFKPIHLKHISNLNNDDKTDLELEKPENIQNHKQNLSGVNRIVRKESTTETIDPVERKERGLPPAIPKSVIEEHIKSQCWNGANVKKHFKIMNEIDDRFASVRDKYQEMAENKNFDQEMLKIMLKTKGKAMRAIHEAAGYPDFIPAGINLGGFSMMKLDNSIMFFHRMKLRNNTHFHVGSLHNDLRNMVLKTSVSLNDLHILGAYERTITGRDPSKVFYTPNFGEVELLLRNVQYNMEGRYRLLRNKLTIELVISTITPSDILMTYQGNERNKNTITLQRDDIDEFLDRLRTNLDKWLKDYFNDYLIYFGFEGNKTVDDLSRYDKEKTVALNEFADDVLEAVKNRLQHLNYNDVQIPDFAVTTINGMGFKLSNGVLRGLDTIHRRSLTTGNKEDSLRKIDTIVGFSSLKATYQYEAVFNTGIPPINGILIVTADEIITHMGLTITENPKTFDLLFDSVQQIKSGTLTLEGPANRVIGNFKNLLERIIFTFITNAVIHNVRMLKSISKCKPNLNAFNTGDIELLQENDSKFNEKEIELNSNTENICTPSGEMLSNQESNDIQNENMKYASKSSLILEKNRNIMRQKKKASKKYSQNVKLNLKRGGSSEEAEYGSLSDSSESIL